MISTIKSFSERVFFIILLLNAICLFYPLCCHFGTKRNSRLIGSCQDYMSHVTLFIIGVGRRNRKRGKVSVRIAAPMYRGDFSALFCTPVGRCVSTSTSLHFATYAILDIRFPKSIQAGREWITRTRTLNCRKFSPNFTDDARELPLCSRNNYAWARKFDYRSSFALRIHVPSMYPWYIYIYVDPCLTFNIFWVQSAEHSYSRQALLKL